jgi:hypothetical protein
MLTLSIQHNIYLDRNQRYALHNQEDVDTIGVSIPVWHFKERTSEPAKEVFCHYFLRNPRKEIPIKILKDGYLLCLPFRITNRPQRELSNAEWLSINQEQREAYYTSTPREMSSASLLDIQDGGSETLMYRESNTVKNGDKFMKIVHYVSLYDMKYLNRSLQNVSNKKENEVGTEPSE